MSIEEKLENFKTFVKSVSRNTDTINEYENITWFKMQALAYVLLIPQKDNLDLVVNEMQRKLDFDDKHKPKFQRYLEFFIEYLTGSASVKPAQTDISGLSYDEQLTKMMKLMNGN